MIKIFNLRIWTKKDIHWLVDSLNDDIKASVDNDNLMIKQLHDLAEQIDCINYELSLIKKELKLMKSKTKVKK
jgi:hypothetical protein